MGNKWRQWWLWRRTWFGLKTERERERERDRERERGRWARKRGRKISVLKTSWQFAVLLLLFTPLGQSDPWLTSEDQWTSWNKHHIHTQSFVNRVHLHTGFIKGHSHTRHLVLIHFLFPSLLLMSSVWKKLFDSPAKGTDRPVFYGPQCAH